ncbi:hypothetical protein BJ138DRAFT_1157796 [Hygrophoropsis aurantiaca]|uniref:Uncharacterized protein n=1 Tax=Hygrophoropsis aurantiaca TaxID=72124 RepID=A0ACB8A4J8_9AGAM|nr:hypothetical protein BJ138DRAFT_1157796 [Hygrophoropsis aurantiaca]
MAIPNCTSLTILWLLAQYISSALEAPGGCSTPNGTVTAICCSVVGGTVANVSGRITCEYTSQFQGGTNVSSEEAWSSCTFSQGLGPDWPGGCTGPASSSALEGRLGGNGARLAVGVLILCSLAIQAAVMA